MNTKVAVVGAGPAGLFTAYCLVKAGIKVDLYDANGKPGKKYILAGLSGLNITNSCGIEKFAKKYGSKRELFLELLHGFSPDDLVRWYRELGFGTIEGSSGKILLEKGDASSVLDKWLSALEKSGCFTFHPFHRLASIGPERSLFFSLPGGAKKKVKSDFAVFALGGASRPETGSDGSWVVPFSEAGVKTVPFRPANCGFSVSWSPLFAEKGAGKPVKNIKITHNGKDSHAEVLITGYGIEGGGIYELSASLRDEAEKKGKAVVSVDLLPDMGLEEVRKRFEKTRKTDSISNRLRKGLNIKGVKYLLLRELAWPSGNSTKEKKPHPGTGRQEAGNAEAACFFSESIVKNPETVKNLKLAVESPRPIEEAISSAGGISFDSLDRAMMLKNLPGFYAVGEMTDWEAPTGGFLLQGCFSTAYRAAQEIIRKIEEK